MNHDEICGYLISQFGKKYVDNNEDLKAKAELKESWKEFKDTWRFPIVIGKAFSVFILLILFFHSIADIDIYFETNRGYEYQGSVLYSFFFLTISVTGLVLIFRKKLFEIYEVYRYGNSQYRGEVSGEKSGELKGHDKKVHDMVISFMESITYQEVFKVYNIIFKEKNIFTQEEISRFIDNEIDLFKASYERIKKNCETYIDEISFKELILKWSEKYMQEKILEMFNGVSKSEPSITDKYFALFGQFKDN